MEVGKNINIVTAKMPKRRRKNRFPWLLIIFLSVGLIFMVIFSEQKSIFPFKQNSNALLDSVPQNFSIYGIDISHYQKKINWDKLAQFKYKHITITFVFIKATEGVNYVDPMWDEHWKNAKTHGFVRGAYHYYKPNLDPVKQMNHFLKQVFFENGDLSPVLDVEEDPVLISHQQFVKNVLTALRYLENKTGITPILYTNYAFYKQYFMGEDFRKYPLWIAHYYKKSPPDDIPWNFWQFHDKMSLDGIMGNVDMNIYCCSFAEFKKFLKN